MILQDVNDKLVEIDPNVFYGMILENDIKERDLQLWNYIVFHRKSKTLNEQKQSYGEHFIVTVVRENYLPEGLEESVIEKVCELHGVRMVGEGSYSYVQKPKTNVVVEMFSVEFVKAKKRVIA